jgi:hypothetical protein
MNHACSVCRTACVAITWVFAALASSPARGDAISDRVNKALEFLFNEHDRWTSRMVLFDDRDSGAQMYYPTNWAGDRAGLRLDSGSTQHVFAGTSATHIDFIPTPGAAEKWASITWAYPDVKDGNWGRVRGRDLMGAKSLSLWIRGTGVVDLKIGGINWIPNKNPQIRFEDPFEVVRRQVNLNEKWQHIVLEIPRATRRDNVVGGFTIGFNESASLDLDEVAYDRAISREAPRLIRSYVPTAEAKDDWIRNPAFLYDNALVALALLSRSNPQNPAKKRGQAGDCEERALLLLDSICWAQTHDRHYHDGRWRNGYAPGPLEDESTKAARLPGLWNRDTDHFDEDAYVVSSDVGNVSWSCLALLTSCEFLEKRKQHRRLDSKEQARFATYLEAARNGAEWIATNCQVADGFGGFSGGFDGWEPSAENPDGPTKLKWRSTEHNLDFFVVCQKLASLTTAAEEVTRWRDRAEHARKFVLSMWQKDHFATGTTEFEEINSAFPPPLDAQTWTILAMGHDPEFRAVTGWSGGTDLPACIDWTESNCRVTVGKAAGYRFSSEGTNCWPEGTSQLAAVYRYIGESRKADRILTELIGQCKIKQPPPSNKYSVSGIDVPGGLPAAFPDDAETGFVKIFWKKEEKWTYKSRMHTGATAWLILGAQRENNLHNPFWLLGVPAQKSSPRQ